MILVEKYSFEYKFTTYVRKTPEYLEAKRSITCIPVSEIEKYSQRNQLKFYDIFLTSYEYFNFHYQWKCTRARLRFNDFLYQLHIGRVGIFLIETNIDAHICLQSKIYQSFIQYNFTSKNYFKKFSFLRYKIILHPFAYKFATIIY